MVGWLKKKKSRDLEYAENLLRAASEVPSLISLYNTMAQEGRVIEAIDQSVAERLVTLSDEQMIKLAKLCKEAA